MRAITGVAVVAALTLAGCGAPGGSDATPVVHPIDAALAFLEDEVEGAGRVWAPRILQAVSQLELDPAEWPAGNSILDAVEAPRPGDPYSATLWVAHALGSAGLDPRDWNGVDLVAGIQAGHDGVQWGDPASITDDAWAVLALYAAGADMQGQRIQQTADRLLLLQGADGGWSWRGVGESGVDVTAWVVWMLQAADRLDPATVARATAFFDASRGADGAIGANCQSTGLALASLDVLGAPRGDADAYLLSCQTDGGGFAHQPGGEPDLWVTVDVLPGFAGVEWPWRHFEG